jgi:hypothetical protein
MGNGLTISDSTPDPLPDPFVFLVDDEGAWPVRRDDLTAGAALDDQSELPGGMFLNLVVLLRHTSPWEVFRRVPHDLVFGNRRLRAVELFKIEERRGPVIASAFSVSTYRRTVGIAAPRLPRKCMNDREHEVPELVADGSGAAGQEFRAVFFECNKTWIGPSSRCGVFRTKVGNCSTRDSSKIHRQW